MDAVHLKGAWNRVTLKLPFKDANNNIVHVATTVCEKEDTVLIESVHKIF